MKNKNLYLILLLFLLIGGIALLVLRKFDANSQVPLPAAVIESETGTLEETAVSEPSVPLSHYIEIVGGCNYAHEGTCVNLRSGPGLASPVLQKLRMGIVFKVEAETTTADGYEWYKIIFDKKLEHPERVTGDWYVASDPDAVHAFDDVGEVLLDKKTSTLTTKVIIVDISKQELYAYEGDTLFMKETISTGVEINPTPVGTYTIFRKTPSRYMQGPIPDLSDDFYDLPGVSWDMYFTSGGAALHGAYWHNNFGQPMSHGCINQFPENAKKLYDWAPLGTPVVIQR